MRRLGWTLVVMALAACGGEEDGSLGFEKKASGDASAIFPGCGAYQEPVESAVSAALVNEERWLPLDQLYFVEDEKTSDLCELFRSHPGDYVVLQFASLPCYRCLKWIDQIGAAIPGDETPGRYQHVVVAMPRKGESEEEWESLRTDVAPGARWILDYKGGLWDFFSLEEQTVTDPLAVVFARTARGFFTQDAALDFAGFKSKIEEVLQPSP